MNFFLHELIHLAGGLLVGFLFYKKTKNVKLIFVSAAMGLLIDIDHLFDLFLYCSRKGISFSPLLVFGKNYFESSEKIYVLFHGYEFVLIFILLSFIFAKWRNYLQVIAFSLLMHLFIDQLTYNPYFLEYSLAYRILNNFSISPFY